MAENVKGRRRRNRSRISSKHQVTIPVAVLRQTGLSVGDVVQFAAAPGGTVHLVKVEDPIEALIGSMPGLSAGFDLEVERDAWAG